MVNTLLGNFVSGFRAFDKHSFAQPTQVPGGDLLGLAPMIIIFVLFYFMLIRPQMKQAKEHKAMVSELKAGDEVATSGGLIGKITKVDDGIVSIEIAANTVINVQKHAVQTLLPPGTAKSI